MPDAKTRVAQAELALHEARLALHRERGEKQIKCVCGQFHAIKQLVLLIDHWYTEPHGCTGGDYWNEGEPSFACPVDGTINRLLFDDYHLDWRQHGRTESEFKGLYRGVFKEYQHTWDDHYKGCRANWSCNCPARAVRRNNYYVDQNREYFDLTPKLVK